MTRIKKAQSGTKIDTTGLRANLNRASTALDSIVKSKIASGTKVWTPQEKAKWKNEKKDMFAPPKGFKPKKTMKSGGKVKKGK